MGQGTRKGLTGTGLYEARTTLKERDGRTDPRDCEDLTGRRGLTGCAARTDGPRLTGGPALTRGPALRGSKELTGCAAPTG